MTESEPDFTYGQLSALMSPLNGNRVKDRRQGGRKLSYLEAYDVRATLIRMFGFGGWDGEVIEDSIIDVKRTEMPPEDGKSAYERIEVAAKVRFRLTIHQPFAVYSETAVASQTGRDIGEVADFAVKTAASDALKRCAANLGNQFGLGLYADSLADPVRVLLEPGQRKVYMDGLEAARAAQAEGQGASGGPQTPAERPADVQAATEAIAEGIEGSEEVPADGSA